MYFFQLLLVVLDLREVTDDLVDADFVSTRDLLE
jgi:hypothetical protein